MDSRLSHVSRFLSHFFSTNPMQSGNELSREDLLFVGEQNNKQRFSISDDGKRIRAAQGHSIAVTLGLIPEAPPEFLFHGTATRFLDSINKNGINAGSRQLVHLSTDLDTAFKVGQ